YFSQSAFRIPQSEMGLNQLSSRQRRRCVRARCSITHRLFTLIFKSSQISSLSKPSTSRKVKALAILSGRGERQFLKTSQNSSCLTNSSGFACHSLGPK